MVKQILFLEGKEVHLISDSVAVCWNTKTESIRDVKIIDGIEYTGIIKKTSRKDSKKPYILLISIRENTHGDLFIDDDCPVDGGIDAEYALQIAEELKIAAKYIESLKNEQSN